MTNENWPYKDANGDSFTDGPTTNIYNSTESAASLKITALNLAVDLALTKIKAGEEVPDAQSIIDDADEFYSFLQDTLPEGAE